MWRPILTWQGVASARSWTLRALVLKECKNNHQFMETETLTHVIQAIMALDMTHDGRAGIKSGQYMPCHD